MVVLFVYRLRPLIWTIGMSSISIRCLYQLPLDLSGQSSTFTFSDHNNPAVIIYPHTTSRLPSFASFCSVGQFRIVDSLYRRSIAYQCFSGTVESMAVVSSKLGVCALQRGVPRSLRLLDAVNPSVFCNHIFVEIWRTRCGGPCATDCAARNSLTLST